MTEENTYRTYTFIDIQQYLSGSMNSAEMHAMEKAALQDPFLADAIEGYRNADAGTASKHLNEINAALNGEQKDAKIISINRNKKQWWRVGLMVASVAAAIIAGVYLFNNNNTDKTNVAQVKKNVKSITSTQKNDTAFVITNTTDAVKKDNSIATIGKKNKEINSRDNEVITAEGTAAVNQPATASNDLYIAAVQDTEEITRNNNNESSAPVEKTISTAKPENLIDKLQGKVAGADVSNKKRYIYSNNNMIALNGRVFDNTGKAVPNAMINISGTNTTVVTDATGKFKISIPDTVSQATVSAVGYDAKEIALASRDKNIIFLQQNNTSLNEVVVTSLGLKKDASEIKVSADKKNATPVGGWEVFEGYVQGRLSIIQDTTDDNYIYGNEVELEFAIDENGNPYNFSVISPPDSELDKKTIDAVAEGPRWICKSKNKKTRVKIKF